MEADLAADDTSSHKHRLRFSRTNFDDYHIALLSKIRADDAADAILSGERPHPLVKYQTDHAAALRHLHVQALSLIHI